ncbi:hypothetical protein [Algibacter sp. 2305UL17-15]|uniref:hypothetical protein n=1 Tax=Algibacter sp. 2305UL17-15 TaxID=3231268 RepID=UPI0034574BFA
MLCFSKQIITLLVINSIFCFSISAQDIENIGNQEPFQISGAIGGTTIYFNADGRTAVSGKETNTSAEVPIYY